MKRTHGEATFLGHFAGRGLAGAVDNSVVGTTKRKCGIRHVRTDNLTGEEREVLVIGGACSEIFSGKNLADVLRPGLEREISAMKRLEADDFADLLSIHTSAGVPSALGEFLEQLQPHLPWAASEDWCASVQLEGGTAVFAGIDLLLQLQKVRGHMRRTKVAVAERSYHGPAASSPGAPSAPLFAKDFQVTYPAPHILRKSTEGLEAEFKAFLDKYGEEVGVIIFEPQWGSSNAALPWPADTLKHFIGLAHERGILVMCDEIMCGLGRHGRGSCFLSTDLGLHIDAVTFGKAMASGVFPLSGVAIRTGTSELRHGGKGVLHMHTYAGSSQLALMAGTEVLRMLPGKLGHVKKMEAVIQERLRGIEAEHKGFLTVQGQGLMWGIVFAGAQEKRVAMGKELRKHCVEAGVWPYFIPIGGCMISPLLDVKEADLHKSLDLLTTVVRQTVAACA